MGYHLAHLIFTNDPPCNGATSPQWAASAFMFEANNHVLLKMLHGTQHVPPQISETFMLARRVNAIASRYFRDDANPAVVSTFEKLAV